MKQPICLAVLDTMWGGPRNSLSPLYFFINPENHSGKRLYKLTGNRYRVLATNACPTMAATAREHGKPDAKYLAANLDRLQRYKPPLVLVCGRVATETFLEAIAENGCGFDRVIMMPHPAARIWTKRALQATTDYLAKNIDNDAILAIKGGDLVINEL